MRARQLRQSVCGHDIAVHEWGRRESATASIIALHGFTGSAYDFVPLIEACVGAKPPLHWLAPDWLGHGDSHKPRLPEAYSVDTACQIIESVLRLVPVHQPVLLLAYSMGGRLAMHYLTQHCIAQATLARSFSCCLIGSSPSIEAAADRAQRLHADQYWQDLLDTGDIDRFCDQWEAQPIIASQIDSQPHMARDLQLRRRRNDPHALSAALQGWGTAQLPSLWHTLPTQQNVHIAFGASDHKFAQIAAAMQRLRPHYRCHPIPQSGHAPHWENPHATANLLPL